MKTLALPLVICIMAFMAGTATGQITNSAHDFAKAGAFNAGGEICEACHTPHNSNTSYSPLWDHAVTSATFTLYDNTVSSTFDGATSQPTGTSKLCLSCHDGTVGIDNFGGSGGTTMITGDDLIGIDLTNDHPISFDYTTALANTDGELYDPSTALSGMTAAGTIATDMLFSNSMECASCHDVHNSAGFTNLLVLDNAGSALCLTCHDK